MENRIPINQFMWDNFVKCFGESIGYPMLEIFTNCEVCLNVVSKKIVLCRLEMFSNDISNVWITDNPLVDHCDTLNGITPGNNYSVTTELHVDIEVERKEVLYKGKMEIIRELLFCRMMIILFTRKILETFCSHEQAMEELKINLGNMRNKWKNPIQNLMNRLPQFEVSFCHPDAFWL